MSGSHQIGFLVLLLILPPSVSTIQKLNSIKDLKSIAFGQLVPAHSLALLHWFANTIQLMGYDNEEIQLTFEPNNGDYGSHRYWNNDGVLPRGHKYYTLGNLKYMNNNQGNCLPSYFTGRLNNLMGREELNRGRIIFSLLNRNTIHQVYITQHYEANRHLENRYDLEHIYQITPNLLRELRDFSLDHRGLHALIRIRNDYGRGINNHQLRDLTNRWGELACLGLLVLIVIGRNHLIHQQSLLNPTHNYSHLQNIDIPRGSWGYQQREPEGLDCIKMFAIIFITMIAIAIIFIKINQFV